MSHIFPVHSFVEGHDGCFSVVAIFSRAVVNFVVPVSFSSSFPTFISLCVLAQWGDCWNRSYRCLQDWKDPLCCFPWTSPSRGVGGFHFSPGPLLHSLFAAVLMMTTLWEDLFAALIQFSKNELQRGPFYVMDFFFMYEVCVIHPLRQAFGRPVLFQIVIR